MYTNQIKVTKLQIMKSERPFEWRHSQGSIFITYNQDYLFLDIDFAKTRFENTSFVPMKIKMFYSLRLLNFILEYFNNLFATDPLLLDQNLIIEFLKSLDTLIIIDAEQ